MSDSFRRWSLTAADPFCGVIAADARFSKTDYQNDQSWELRLGQGDSTALSLNTRYGGRVGLASVAPIWIYEGRSIYSAIGYSQSPAITRFAPGYIRAEARLIPEISLIAEFLSIESHSVVGRFLLSNQSQKAVDIQLDLVIFAASEQDELTPKRLKTANGTPALGLPFADLKPVITMEGALVDDYGARKLIRKLSIPAGGKTALQWSAAGLATYNESVALAGQTVRVNFAAHSRRILQAAPEIPVIETGDLAIDAAIAASYQQIIQSLLKPTLSLPYASFVSTRQPERGADSVRSWSGQNPTHAYLVALATAQVNPSLAQGILLNYLAVQREDGWIDWKPSLDGQRQGILCLPILARMAWNIFQYTEDQAFLKQSYPALGKFFERWLQPDLDTDGDGFPEWQSEVQTGYPYSSAFAIGMSWGQNADIRYVEAPDLIAYLLSEATSLYEMAHLLGDSAGASRYQSQVDRLSGLLEALWQEGRYHYQDRDLNVICAGNSLLDDVRGSEDLSVGLEIQPANRLIISIHGGAERPPKFVLKLGGKDAHGNIIEEEVDSKVIVWTHSRGVYTSRYAWSRLDTIATAGLTSVFKVRLSTMDTTAYDISTLIPFWAATTTPQRSAELANAIEKGFLKSNGITMADKTETLFDPANARGPGGIWLFWNTLLGEGFVETGMIQQAFELLNRLLKMQTEVLRLDKRFYEFYHTDQARGLGERGSVAGVMPLHLLMRVLGVRVISPSVVWAGGAFHGTSPVTVRHRGVVVQRAEHGTRITFPSGYQQNLPADAPFTRIVDPSEKSVAI